MNNKIKEKLNKIKDDKTSLIIIMTVIISIIISSTLLANYFASCQKYKYQVDYSIHLHTCYCQASVTSQNLLNQFLASGYDTQAIDTTSLKDNQNVIYINFPEASASTIFFITSVPSFISTSYGNYSTLIDIEYGIAVPISTFDNQINSMLISNFVLSNSIPFQVPIAIAYPGTSHYAIVIFTFNENCANLANHWPDVSFGGIVNGSSFAGGVCLYFLQSNYYTNINNFCLNNDCNKIVEFGNNITKQLASDLEKRVFSISPPKYCRPNFCLISQCVSLNLYTCILLCISSSSSAFVVIKVFFHIYFNKKTNQKNDTQMNNI